MNINEFVALAKRVHDAEGMSFSGGDEGREMRNKNWARIVGIAFHGHPLYNPTPDPQWHLKNGGRGRPQSDDVVVSMPSRAFWDCIPNSGIDGYWFAAGAHPEPLPMIQEVYPPPVPDGGGVAAPPPQTSGDWTAKHEEIRLKMAGRSAVNVAEQLAYTFPGERWGQKRTRGGSWSPDTIARIKNGKIWAVKIIPAVVIYGTLSDTDHAHLEAQPMNHLGDAPVPPVVPPAVPEPPTPEPPSPPPVVVTPEVLTLLSAILDTVIEARDYAKQAAEQQYGFTGEAKSPLGKLTGSGVLSPLPIVPKSKG